MESDFLRWCRASGISWFGVEAAHFGPYGRGIVATASLPPDTLVVKVPGRVLMSNRSAFRDAKLTLAVKQNGLNQQQSLALHLLHQISKGPESLWWTYMRTLPRMYTTLMHFTDEEVEALEFPHACNIARNVVNAATESWSMSRRARRAVGLDRKWRSRAAWLWASSTLASRTMFVPFDKGGALTPFGDFFNYEPPPPPISPYFGVSDAQTGSAGIGIYDEENDEYQLRTQRRYEKGEQVFMCYGAYTNLELLENYGFILENNPHETVVIPLGLLDLHITEDFHQCNCYALYDGSPSWETLKLLRLSSATHAERAEYGHLAVAGQKISDESEERALERWRKGCLLALDCGVKSLEEDLEDLEQIGSDQTKLRLAVTWRIVQKRILLKGASLV